MLTGIGTVVAREVSRAELMQEVGGFDVLIVRLAHQIDREVIDLGQRLKAIVTATTGLDHIDIEYARDRGIVVLSLRGEADFLRSVNATPEHTWALLLVNTSRGQLIDEGALVAALEDGHMAGAALDVIDNERDRGQRTGSPLLAYARAHDNLLITPHIAGATYESMVKTEVFMARKLRNFFISSGVLNYRRASTNQANA